MRDYSIFSRFVVFILSVSVLGLVGCGAKGNKPNVEVIQDMMEQPALKAQDFHPQDREKSSMLVPPKGTWPKNLKPYLYQQSQNAEASKQKNPLAGQMSGDVLEKGKRHFNNYCALCHGPTGLGDGQIAAKFGGIKIPSLMTDKIKTYPDGRIFHIITTGQGLMGAYITQMPRPEDRWAVVNYIRSLQKK